jgi:hypothetical protein
MRTLFFLLLFTSAALAHGDWDWIARGFPDYHSQYNRQWSCCGEHDIERITDDRWYQDGGYYVIDGEHRIATGKSFPSEVGSAVIAWHLGDWVVSADAGMTKVPNVPGKIYNGRHIIGVHCFFFSPGGV